MDDLQLILKKKENSKLSDYQDSLSLVDRKRTKVTTPVTLVEKVLISRLNIGDTSAFSFIFNAYYKDLVIFASRFTNDRVNSEEIVEDTFVKLWEEHESLNISVSIKSYLLKTVQNKCIDWYRHRKIMRIHDHLILQSSPRYVYETDNYILQSELQEQIDAALAKLPDEISGAFRMNRYKGLKYHEISKIMGVSVRTIEVRIGRALNLLRNHLKDYFIIICGLFSCLLSNMY
jgi:RNA polymerase sigma-70 factor, ECF subfamily